MKKSIKILEEEMIPKALKKKFEKEIKHLKETKIPRCIHCKKNFIKVMGDKYSSVWKPNCKCIKKDIRLCIG